MRKLADTHKENVQHIPVLLETILENINPSGIWVDGTFGAGGYSRSLLEQGVEAVVAIDRDPAALKASKALEIDFRGQFTFFQGKFSELENFISSSIKISGIVFDLGVSSMQLDQAKRGFSFLHDGPLDMRMGEAEVSASDIVNFYDEESIADILFQYGEERFSRVIAKKIVNSRPIESTLRLSNIIKSCFNDSFRKTHPATKSFQALRIAVNDELVELVKGLEIAERMLEPGGQLAVVTFHSLEDRIVKKFMRARTKNKENMNRHLPNCTNIDPSFMLKRVKPYLVKSEERELNNRSRSAKLRIATRTNASAHPQQNQKLGLPRLALESLTA
ncbi:MAG: 16S rRNA (cytosine(1402)-N(4))-methyltransferase RsmH [Paracoccaceae bacterium]